MKKNICEGCESRKGKISSIVLRPIRKKDKPEEVVLCNKCSKKISKNQLYIP